MSTIGDVFRWQGVMQFFDDVDCVKCGRKIENGTHGVQFLTRVGLSEYTLDYCLDCGAKETEEDIKLYKQLLKEIKAQEESNAKEESRKTK